MNKKGSWESGVRDWTPWLWVPYFNIFFTTNKSSSDVTPTNLSFKRFSLIFRFTLFHTSFKIYPSPVYGNPLIPSDFLITVHTTIRFSIPRSLLNLSLSSSSPSHRTHKSFVGDRPNWHRCPPLNTVYSDLWRLLNLTYPRKLKTSGVWNSWRPKFDQSTLRTTQDPFPILNPQSLSFCSFVSFPIKLHFIRFRPLNSHYRIPSFISQTTVSKIQNSLTLSIQTLIGIITYSSQI